MFYENDTITAISTPFGIGGISIIRISGNEAFKIAGKMFKARKNINEMESHTINYGKIIDPLTGTVIDEVLLTRMDKPNTFTRENIIEINCHGGIAVVKRVLELIIKAGARLADPGEFTKRAFLNGRLDLSQAEAVIDVINAKTYESSKVAIGQLEGRLSNKIKEIRDILVTLIAQIEVTLDYPEEDVDNITEKEVYFRLKKIKIKLNELLISFNKGKILREGISAVIVGRPNVGKSSLLNELSGHNRAIVTELPGTTRDIIEEYINIKGIPVKLIDTAGIRETGDMIEKIGVNLAKDAINKADLIIMMLDSSEGLTEDDENILKIVKEKDKKLIILQNKIDLINDVDKPQNLKTIKTSMLKGTGIDELENEIEKLLLEGDYNISEDAMVTNIRHADIIENTLISIEDAISSFEEKMPLDCMTIDIRNAVLKLGEITGESVGEEIINEIFSKFCIGK